MASILSEDVLRTQLAATYRVFAMLGWDELIYNHISFRIPGEADSRDSRCDLRGGKPGCVAV
jgi:ribulose-5-phosphate 4-epimerase/fuculose-1-phosphate aldolase